jgi:DNA-binding HxlR family transcriptional regulator
VTPPARQRYHCPVELALDTLGGKWKSVLLAHLKQGALRYSELRRRVPPRLSDKMLTERLRDLEARGLILRRPERGSAHVVYALTPRGRSLRPVLQALYDWGEQLARETSVTIG